MKLQLTTKGSKAYFVERSLFAGILLLTIIGWVFPVIGMIKRYLEIKTTKFEFKENSINYSHGILSSTQSNLALWRINDFELKQNLLDKIFKTCSIIIYSQDISSKNFMIQGLELSQGSEVITFLEHNVSLARNNNNVRNLSV